MARLLLSVFALFLLLSVAQALYYFTEDSCVPIAFDVCVNPDFAPDCHAVEGGFGDTVYECSNVENPEGYESPMFVCEPAYGAVYHCYMKEAEGTLDEVSSGSVPPDEEGSQRWEETPQEEEREVDVDEVFYDSDCIPVSEGCAPPEELVEAGVCRHEGVGYMCSAEGLRAYSPAEEQEGPSHPPEPLGLSEEEKSSLRKEVEQASPEEVLSLLAEVGERLRRTAERLMPPLKRAIFSPADFVQYAVETGAVDRETAEEAAGDFDWEAYERMTSGVGYTPTEDEAELWEENPELLRKGLREQVVRKAVVKEGVAKAEEMLSKMKEMEVSTEGYQHNVGTGWSTFTKLLDILQVASAGVAGKAELIKSAAETLITNEVDSMRNAYLGEDDALALGAKFMLEAHQGYAEARATGLGYPPQRFLYGCSRGKYDSVKCERDEESGAYRLKVKGKEVVVSHFVRMKDKEGNVYWVGTDDPEAVDEEALEKATIVLKEVNGWLWKSDNVEVIDPKTGEVVGEEDLPGMFG